MIVCFSCPDQHQHYYCGLPLVPYLCNNPPTAWTGTSRPIAVRDRYLLNLPKYRDEFFSVLQLYPNAILGYFRNPLELTPLSLNHIHLLCAEAVSVFDVFFFCFFFCPDLLSIAVLVEQQRTRFWDGPQPAVD